MMLPGEYDIQELDHHVTQRAGNVDGENLGRTLQRPLRVSEPFLFWRLIAVDACQWQIS